ncbi:MAG: TonB-dependent receptor [Bacteroidia bacterium]|nr:TonB-dependent receptor [Bacteroidia bacterium]
MVKNIHANWFMKGVFLISFFIFCNNLFLQAQTYTQTIRGKVIDVDSKSPVFGANIILLNSDTLIGAVTDVDGKFRLEKIPVGRRAIKITSLGYEESFISNIIVSSAKEIVLTIELREKIYQTETVEIVSETDKTKANNDLVTVSSRNFQAEETNRYAGSRGDPSKMVANYAGVSSGNDARNDIIVRGNSPLGVLWRLEGVDIPNPNHFSAQGATGGPISMLNNNVLGNSDFLTGAFPAEYGNKTAAVFDLKLRNGNNEKTEFTGQLGINGIELGAEGPISKKQGSSYLVNYRYSTLEVFNQLGIRFGVSASPAYQDVCYKVNLPTLKSGIFTLWGIGGTSKLSLLDSELKPEDWSYISKGEDLVFKTSMAAAGASHTYFFNEKTVGKFTLSASGTLLDAFIDTISSVDKSKFLDRKNKSTEANFIGNYTLTKKLNAKHLIKSGITFQTIYFDANSYEYSNEYNQYLYSLNVKGATANLVQGFIHWQFRPTDKVTINSGLHYQNFLLNNSQALEPRLGARFQLSKKQNFNIAYGMHSQMQPTIYYFYDTYIPTTNNYYKSNRNLGLSKSHHAVMSYDYNFFKNYRFKLETYYQYLYDFPVQQNWNSSFSMINVGNALEGIPLVDTLVNIGAGENYGVEFTIEKFFSNHFYFLLTASIYDSKYKDQKGVLRNTSYNGNFVANALAGYELQLGKNKNKAMALDFKYTQAGGNRYTPIDIEKSKLLGKAVYNDDEAFSKKQKDYSRFDVKLSYKTNRRKTAQSIFVVVENIFNTQNILRESYNADSQMIQKEYQLGLFYYFGYRIEF